MICLLPLILAAAGGSGIVMPPTGVNGQDAQPSSVETAQVDAGTLNFGQGFGTNLDAGSIWVTQLDAGSVLAVTVTTSAASGSNAVAVTAGSRVSLSGSTDYFSDNGSGAGVWTTNNPAMVTSMCIEADTGALAIVEMCGGSGGVLFDSASGSKTVSVGTSNASAVVVGTSTTTKPTQIAGGSGAFVGTCSMSTSTSCTATVPTGAKCVCFPQTAVAVTSLSDDFPYGAVSSTTFTCNSGNVSNSAVWTILCL